MVFDLGSIQYFRFVICTFNKSFEFRYMPVEERSLELLYYFRYHYTRCRSIEVHLTQWDSLDTAFLYYIKHIRIFLTKFMTNL